MASGINGDRKVATRIDLALLILRLVVGIIFLAHGSQKFLGAFGGAGLVATQQQMGPVLAAGRKAKRKRYAVCEITVIPRRPGKTVCLFASS